MQTLLDLGMYVGRLFQMWVIQFNVEIRQKVLAEPNHEDVGDVFGNVMFSNSSV